MNDVLTASGRQRLVKSERINLGKYGRWQSHQEFDFIVAVDARPLAALIADASCGHRVYELMTITRPGDILSYLWLTYERVDDQVVEWVERYSHSEAVLDYEDKQPMRALPFVRFDRCFKWLGDDMQAFEALWRQNRESVFWIEKMRDLLALVRTAQGRLRQCGDFLIEHEVAMIDAGGHPRDFLDQIERRTTLESVAPRTSSLPDEVRDAIEALIEREDVGSVACALDDYWLWRRLVTEQVRRSQRSGRLPQEAFRLSGPDEGLRLVNATDWGGEVHIPYEGFCDGDVLIPPPWRRFGSEHAGPGGRLDFAFGSCEARYVLTRQDRGEMACARRKVLGEWVLYESIDPRCADEASGQDRT